MSETVEPYSPTRQFRKSRQNLLRGRKGVPNTVPASFRWGLLEAYRKLGSEQALYEWAVKEENRSLFYQLCARTIPCEMAESSKGGEIRVLVYAPQNSKSSEPIQAIPQQVVSDVIDLAQKQQEVNDSEEL